MTPRPYRITRDGPQVDESGAVSTTVSLIGDFDIINAHDDLTQMLDTVTCGGESTSVVIDLDHTA